MTSRALPFAEENRLPAKFRFRCLGGIELAKNIELW